MITHSSIIVSAQLCRESHENNYLFLWCPLKEASVILETKTLRNSENMFFLKSHMTFKFSIPLMIPQYSFTWPSRSMWQLIMFSIMKYFTSFTSLAPMFNTMFNWFCCNSVANISQFHLLPFWYIHNGLLQDLMSRVLISTYLIHSYGLIYHQCANNSQICTSSQTNL